MPKKKLTDPQISQNREVLRFLKSWIIFRETSQKRIAEALGVSPATMSKWLAGRQTISVSSFMAICRLLSAAPEDVLSGPPVTVDGKGSQYRRLAELAEALTHEQLDAMIAVGEQLSRRR